MVVVLLSGCAGVASSVKAVTSPRMSNDAKALFSGADTATEGVAVTFSGQDVDRASGILYDWTIYENGAVTLKGRDPMTKNIVSVVIVKDGNVYTMNGRLRSVYDPSTDICEVISGEKGRGSQCIHPVTRHFFMSKNAPESHVMISLAK